ncbi:Xaa-Pro aminopeptidase [Dysgonomonas sp. PH5-45]|uniref:aminopeptidase P family protein n=1 Tax=unclassified Dysgonomonas TaxID=2630389 RepID=UPI0024735519|nr:MULTISPECIES: aminopeptidase P family protein [unclassified Dysgonomonas]MDH6355673.1 Xaa-Pro aminopeptidase [Dysgonomonas sp. PH5-45]MDH6388570.1 Xaa-Pro aminopeptidase [Dysgonomonas sp. PH5-37]
MHNKIVEHLKSLRTFMEEKGLNAFIIPSTDPHLSEYPATHWEARKWISGFTGSAGTVVVTREKAGLWTDSRYFLQAATELKDTTIELFKDGLPTTPSIDRWLASELEAGEYVGIDGNVYAAKEAFELTHKLNMKGLHVIADYDPFASIWHDRPEIPRNPIFEMPIEYAGESCSSKIKRLTEALEDKGADALLVASLDTVAWIFNIRGNDVHCNPVAVAYGYVSAKETVLFINPAKLTPETSAYLKKEGVVLAEYDKVGDYISKLDPKTRVCLNGAKTSFSLYNKIPKGCAIVDIPSPADLMKAVKNEAEVTGFKSALQRDGVALVRFIMWLEKAVPQGGVTELIVEKELAGFRKQQDKYVGESFDTIAGYGPNGAIVHYHVTPESSADVKPEGFLLLDSGGQYFDGTTDITRTIAVGPLTQQMKEDYTMVLKGHINIATAQYPQGTRGSQLDILARKALWDKGLNYLHGTGHGIGHFLNVHEGPQSIRMDENPTQLQPGMVTSNEPGLYRANQYGIRIENLVLTIPTVTTEFGNFYGFETLTVCPIDTTPVIKEMLTPSETEWLNQYHKYVYARLSPLLNDEEKAWLKVKTNEI